MEKQFLTDMSDHGGHKKNIKISLNDDNKKKWQTIVCRNRQKNKQNVTLEWRFSRTDKSLFIGCVFSKKIYI